MKLGKCPRSCCYTVPDPIPRSARTCRNTPPSLPEPRALSAGRWPRIWRLDPNGACSASAASGRRVRSGRRIHFHRPDGCARRPAIETRMPASRTCSSAGARRTMIAGARTSTNNLAILDAVIDAARSRVDEARPHQSRAGRQVLRRPCRAVLRTRRARKTRAPSSTISTTRRRTTAPRRGCRQCGRGRRRGRTTMLHYSPANPRNIVSRSAPTPRSAAKPAAARFSGTERAYTSLAQFTTTTVLSRPWPGWRHPKAAGNKAFNIANGDLLRWSRFWPRLAAAFDMPVGIVRPVILADVMAERGRRGSASSRDTACNREPWPTSRCGRSPMPR